MSLTNCHIYLGNQHKGNAQSTKKDAQKHYYGFVTKVKVRYLKDLNKVNKKIQIIKSHRNRPRFGNLMGLT